MIKELIKIMNDIDEKSPIEEDPCLVLLGNSDLMIGQVEDSDEGNGWLCHDGFISRTGVTHWMPLEDTIKAIMSFVEINQLETEIEVLHTILKRYEPWRPDEPEGRMKAIFFGKDMHFWTEAKAAYEKQLSQKGEVEKEVKATASYHAWKRRLREGANRGSQYRDGHSDGFEDGCEWQKSSS